MTPLLEDDLRKRADGPTNEIISLWKSESQRAFGQAIEIVVDSRHNCPVDWVRLFSGDLNTSRPARYKGKLVLSIWLEKFYDLNCLMLTHEIGHCLLKLRGFHGLVCDLEDEQILAGLLNDVGTHVALYALQRSIGHEPQSEIDSRIDYNIKSCSKAKPGTIHETQTTLLLADDILNCSKAKGELLKSTLRKNLPKVLGLVETIVSESSKYDLHNPEQNVSFRQSLVSRLSLRGNWKALDYLQEIKGL